MSFLSLAHLDRIVKKLTRFYFWLIGQLSIKRIVFLRKLSFAAIGYIFPGLVGIDEIAGDTATRWEIIICSALVVLFALAYTTARKSANTLRAKLVQTLTDKNDATYKIIEIGDEMHGGTD